MRAVGGMPEMARLYFGGIACVRVAERAASNVARIKAAGIVYAERSAINTLKSSRL